MIDTIAVRVQRAHQERRFHIPLALSGVEGRAGVVASHCDY